MNPKDITLIKNAIHRPEEPRHFMRIKELDKVITAAYDSKILIRSRKTLKLQEAGMDLYDPVYYFPKEAFPENILKASDKSSHCPLKGDTTYYHLRLENEQLENVAWEYTNPFDHSAKLKGYVALDASLFQIVEHID